MPAGAFVKQWSSGIFLFAAAFFLLKTSNVLKFSPDNVYQPKAVEPFKSKAVPVKSEAVQNKPEIVEEKLSTKNPLFLELDSQKVVLPFNDSKNAFMRKQSVNLSEIKSEILSKEIITLKMKKTYKQLYEDIYKKYGYSLCLNKSNTLAIADCGKNASFLSLTKRRPCGEVMSEWFKHNAHENRLNNYAPPDKIPPKYYQQFTMEDHTFHNNWYRNDAHNDPKVAPNNWTMEEVQKYIIALQIPEWNWFPYAAETENMVTALKHFPANGHGLVIGSLMPWLETLCLLYGAETLTTAEYHPTVSLHPRLRVIHPIDLAKNYKQYVGKFDFGASFSSLEHSGLARYGDNIDPMGDLLEMEKIRCFLKPNATLYLSFPIGIDTLWWNVHRVYGSIRYPMMMADFEILGIFRGNTTADLHNINWPNDYMRQHTAVLRYKAENECYV